MTNSAVMTSKKRADYAVPSHLISHVDISFELSSDNTLVTNVMRVKRNPLADATSDLVLVGEGIELLDVCIDDKLLQADHGYRQHDNELIIYCSDDVFTLTIRNHVNPKANTSLEGLYFSNDAFCTQCEAEGFRKITYFLDRPDVLSIYTVTLTSNDEGLSYLLSNGNLLSDTGYVNGQRTCVWHDPFPKPCYLFALVAGHFDKRVDTFTTQSGKHVSLELFVDVGRGHQGQHALDSLKKAMAWDEKTYGLEYDLDTYMVVAVDFFNMGAMENKGLNVFNSKFVLANPDTATDTDYFNIESIIAHEYFHNWTGNRVTCRDWFQLSLKEGLTVFRDQQFSADMFSALQTRIDQVKIMREHQFAEDDGPMSHPIRPDEVMEMNNFYTVTVYDKGAEVIRMLHTLLGKAGFRKGMDLYFTRFDGQAVTCDDFVDAMQDANNHDLSHFKRWYSQSGTPIVQVESSCNGAGETILSFEQKHKPSVSQPHKQNLYIPIKMECFDANGANVPLNIENNTLVLTERATSLNVGKVCGDVTPSLLQDFSAPVKIEYNYTPEQHLTIIAKANSDYAKWEAAQSFFIHMFKAAYQHASANPRQSLATFTITNEALINQFVTNVQSVQNNQEVLAQLLTLPSIETAMRILSKANPTIAVQAYSQLVQLFSGALSKFCESVYAETTSQEGYVYNKQHANKRALNAICLKHLCVANVPNVSQVVTQHYGNADNMTDALSALHAARALFEYHQSDVFDALMLRFESKHKDDAVVMDKWFSLHASTARSDILSHLDLLQSHAQYSMTNPNKVRALIGSFAFYNTLGFHNESGQGYQYLADYLIKIDALNPQVASRLITPFIQSDYLNRQHKDLIDQQLSRIFGTPNLSKDLFEKISKTLSASKL
ncbi:MAG: aminopeptidase N [Glaciecola sp.]